MPYNPKSLENLRSYKKGEKRTIESARKGGSSPKKKEAKRMREVCKAFLDAKVPKEQAAKWAERFGVEDDVLTNRFVFVMSLMDIISDKENPATARMQAVNQLIQYAGEDALSEQITAAQATHLAGVEDDPFSKSIKEKIGK